MGICSSKHSQSPASQHGQQVAAQETAAPLDSLGSHATGIDSGAVNGQQPAVQPADAEPKTTRPGSSGEGYQTTPVTPQPVADATPEHKLHRYSSMEKPQRSAMRNSLDTKPDTYSRRSSSSISNVGFSLSGDAPDAEKHRPLHLAGADSISLKKIVDMFYEKVVADPKIGKYFDGIDLAKLKRHQVRFMALAFGGKELVFEEDPNLNLRRVHYHLIRDKGLSLSDWECFVGLFDETMEQLEKDIPAETRHAASRSIRATRHYFVPIGQETEYTSAPLIDVPDPAEGEFAAAGQSTATGA